MSSISKFLVTLLGGVIIGGAGIALYDRLSHADHQQQTPEGSEATTKQPLYWVAPMDANYRRDKPGKSPMGMDLVPVYEEPSESNSGDKHVVKIASHVEQNLGVKTTAVAKGSMNNVINTVGYVQYDENKIFHIHPRVEGWVETLYVKAIGDPVRKDQALYELYSPELVNAQEEFLLALKSKQPKLIRAARNRLQAFKISSAFIDELQKTGTVKQRVTFYSPADGIVDHLNIREGFFVNLDTTLFSIVQLDQLWVEAEVYERDAAVIAPGLPAIMTLDFLPGKTWQGVTDYVYPTLDESSRTLAVRLVFSNHDNLLKPNMFANVQITTKPLDDVLMVPKQSVIRTGEQDRVVLSLGEGQFKSVPVDIGRVGKESIQILSGVSAGDMVVTSAQFLLDSESSKGAELERMSTEKEAVIWAQGTVNHVMTEQRLVNISHGPIEAIGMMGMTMHFELAETIDINRLSDGQELHFRLVQLDTGMYQIVEIHILSEPETTSDNDMHQHH